MEAGLVGGHLETERPIRRGLSHPGEKWRGSGPGWWCMMTMVTTRASSTLRSTFCARCCSGALSVLAHFILRIPFGDLWLLIYEVYRFIPLRSWETWGQELAQSPQCKWQGQDLNQTVSLTRWSTWLGSRFIWEVNRDRLDLDLRTGDKTKHVSGGAFKWMVVTSAEVGDT